MITKNYIDYLDSKELWHPAPKTANDYGEEGWMAYDDFYKYIYVNRSWKQIPLSKYNDF